MTAATTPVIAGYTAPIQPVEHKQFMKDIRFSIVGYGIGTPQQPSELGKRILNIVKFLSDQGGASYLEKLPSDPCAIDIIIVLTLILLICRLILFFFQRLIKWLIFGTSN